MSAFSDLVDEFLGEHHAEHPVQSSTLGLTDYDALLDVVTAEGFERRRAASAAWFERFSSLGSDSLSFDDTIDRDLILASLRDEAIFDEWEVWRRHPDTYLNPGLEGVFILFLHRLRPEAELVRAAVSRLEGIPASLDAGRANLRPELVPALLLKRAIREARAGARYTRDLLPEQVALENRPPLTEAGAAAATALESYADFLADLEPRATGDWAFGEERYNAILRDAEMLSVDARALRERARGEIVQLVADLKAGALQLAGHDD